MTSTALASTRKSISPQTIPEQAHESVDETLHGKASPPSAPSPPPPHPGHSSQHFSAYPMATSINELNTSPVLLNSSPSTSANQPVFFDIVYKNVKLQDVLDGHLDYSDLNLAGFRQYLATKEYNLSNLEYYECFQRYTRLFFRWKEEGGEESELVLADESPSVVPNPHAMTNNNNNAMMASSFTTGIDPSSKLGMALEQAAHLDLAHQQCMSSSLPVQQVLHQLSSSLSQQQMYHHPTGGTAGSIQNMQMLWQNCEFGPSSGKSSRRTTTASAYKSSLNNAHTSSSSPPQDGAVLTTALRNRANSPGVTLLSSGNGGMTLLPSSCSQPMIGTSSENETVLSGGKLKQSSPLREGEGMAASLRATLHQKPLSRPATPKSASTAAGSPTKSGSTMLQYPGTPRFTKEVRKQECLRAIAPWLDGPTVADFGSPASKSPTLSSPSVSPGGSPKTKGNISPVVAPFVSLEEVSGPPDARETATHEAGLCPPELNFLTVPEELKDIIDVSHFTQGGTSPEFPGIVPSFPSPLPRSSPTKMSADQLGPAAPPVAVSPTPRYPARVPVNEAIVSFADKSTSPKSTPPKHNHPYALSAVGLTTAHPATPPVTSPLPSTLTINPTYSAGQMGPYTPSAESPRMATSSAFNKLLAAFKSTHSKGSLLAAVAGSSDTPLSSNAVLGLHSMGRSNSNSSLLMAVQQAEAQLQQVADYEMSTWVDGMINDGSHAPSRHHHGHHHHHHHVHAAHSVAAQPTTYHASTSSGMTVGARDRTHILHANSTENYVVNESLDSKSTSSPLNISRTSSAAMEDGEKITNEKLKDACRQMLRDFFIPNGAKELNIDEIYRLKILYEVEIKRNFHPAVFGPALNQILQTMQFQSFPNYLREVTKKIFSDLISFEPLPLTPKSERKLRGRGNSLRIDSPIAMPSSS